MVSAMRLLDVLFEKLQNIYSGGEREPDTSYQSLKFPSIHELLVFHVNPHEFMEAQQGYH